MSNILSVIHAMRDELRAPHHVFPAMAVSAAHNIWKAADLPVLEGTEKQIDYASGLRAEDGLEIASLIRSVPDSRIDLFDAAAAQVLGNPSAKFWIERPSLRTAIGNAAAEIAKGA